MRPDTGCSDALWSLGRVTPTPSRLPQALTASPVGPVVRSPGPLSPPDRVPARAGTPRGHRQTDPPPGCSLPAAWRGSASCRALLSPYGRWRTATRDDAGTHEQLTAGGTPFRMRVAPLGTHGLPVQGWWGLHRRLSKRRAADGQDLGVRRMIQPVAPHYARLGHRDMKEPPLQKVRHGQRHPWGRGGPRVGLRP
jgi:hypothetical protein